MEASHLLSRLQEGPSLEERTTLFESVGNLLRDEHYRSDHDVQFIIKTFVIPEFKTLNDESHTTTYAIQLFRCLCNFVADNDANRRLVFESGAVNTLCSLLKSDSPKVISLGCTLLQNLVLDNGELIGLLIQENNDIVEILVSTLLKNSFENTQLAISCLEEIGQVLHSTHKSILSLETLAQLVHKMKTSLGNGELDSDTQRQLFHILECLSVLDDYDFSSAAYPAMVRQFFEVINLVYHSENWETEQKSLICKILFDSVGNLSGNPQNDNISTRDVFEFNLTNPYSQILAMVILGNSVNSNKDRNDVIMLLSSKGVKSSSFFDILGQENQQIGMFSLQGWFLIGKLCADEAFAESILESKATIEALVERYIALPLPVTNYYRTGLMLVVKSLQRIFSSIADMSKLTGLSSLIVRWAATTDSPETKDISMNLELVIFKLVERNATNIANSYTEILLKPVILGTQIPLSYIQEKVKVLSMLIANKNDYVLTHPALKKVVDQLVAVSNTEEGSKNPIIVNNVSFLLAKMTQYANYM